MIYILCDLLKLECTEERAFGKQIKIQGSSYSEVSPPESGTERLTVQDRSSRAPQVVPVEPKLVPAAVHVCLPDAGSRPVLVPTPLHCGTNAGMHLEMQLLNEIVSFFAQGFQPPLLCSLYSSKAWHYPLAVSTSL